MHRSAFEGKRRGAAHAICGVVLSATLALGLWPFHAPRNAVSWVSNQDGLRFRRYGTVVGSVPFDPAARNTRGPAGIEIALEPELIWNSSTFLAFCAPGNRSGLSLRQDQTDLVVETGTRDDRHRSGAAVLRVSRVFREPRRVHIAIASDGKGTSVYVNGVLRADAGDFPLSAADLTGRMVLGDSPGNTDSWSGRLLGLAVYHRPLTAAEVFRNHAVWQRSGRFETGIEPGGGRNAAALYDFDERRGSIVRDKGGSGADLYIPAAYLVVDKITLQPFLTEFSMSRNYWKAVLKNIIGFIPFGFFVYPSVVRSGARRPALIAVAAGTAVSLTIEILQAFLPTRDSGTTDLFTNSLGTSIGAASYMRLAPRFAGRFRWYSRAAGPVEPERASAAFR
jgi:hypothetical protein